MSQANILLFSGGPPEYGWNTYSEMPAEIQEQMRQLTDGMLLDLAEQCANIHDAQVMIYETETQRISTQQMLPPMVQSKMQMAGTLNERLREAVEGIYKTDGSAVVIVFLRPNPLFPVAHIHRTMELLHLEDDVVITATDENGTPEFVATRTFHSCVYGSMRSLTEVGAFVVPLPSLKKVSDMADLVYLHHEIERKSLLAQPVPRRTLEVLKRMQRYNLIPEES